MTERRSFPLFWPLTERARFVLSLSEVSGGAYAPLTFFNCALLTSVRNASIFSEGKLTEGRPVFWALMVVEEAARRAVAGLIGASTGGTCFLRAALAATRNDSVEAVGKADF